MKNHDDTIWLRRVEENISAADFDHTLWEQHASPVSLTRYYSGAPAPPERRAEARLIWTPAALCVRFLCLQAEPLVIADHRQTATKTIGLWNRDVCEIFVAPDRHAPERYFEFEAAPTGEWLDLELEWKVEGRATNWEYRSGMEAAGRIGAGEVLVALRVPWTAFKREPMAGEEWRINLFRCVGRDTAGAPRGYVAWQPTFTREPNFHVPRAFGRLRFDA